MITKAGGLIAEGAATWPHDAVGWLVTIIAVLLGYALKQAAGSRRDNWEKAAANTIMLNKQGTDIALLREAIIPSDGSRSIRRILEDHDREIDTVRESMVKLAEQVSNLGRQR